MIDINKTLSDFKLFFENLIQIRALNGYIDESKNTLSFYIYKEPNNLIPMQILRISDHRPDMFNMIREDAPNPSSDDFANLSIEFYVPKYNDKGKIEQNRLKMGVKTTNPTLKSFSVDSYSYTPELLDLDDVGEISASIMRWLFPNQNLVSFVDPFLNTNKEAKYKKGVSKITIKTVVSKVDDVL